MFDFKRLELRFALVLDSCVERVVAVREVAIAILGRR